MSPKPFKGLLLRGLLFLILGLILWIYLEPNYSRLLASVSQEVLSWVEGKERTSIRIQDEMIIYVPLQWEDPGKKGIPAGKRDVRDLHYNSVILFALILFTPGLSFVKRGWVLLIGLGLLFFTQVLTVLVQIKFFYAYQLGEYSRIHYGILEKNLYVFLKQFFELIGRFAFPFVIWLLFTYKETVDYLVEGRRESKHKKKKK
jgi:hypothetical protein